MMRLQKFLALSGVASRRNAEKMIAEGRVAVNGKVITEMGVQVDEFTDKVTVDGTLCHLEEEKHYLAYNKPIGEVTSGKGSLLGAHTYAFLEPTGYSSFSYTSSYCTQWLIQYDDCYCIIELFIRDAYTDSQRLLGYVSDLILAYRLVTESELAELLDDAKVRQQEATRDI